MILFLDTSALVKMYIKETGSDYVFKQVNSATKIATSQVAYPEAKSAFARRMREGHLNIKDHKKIVKSLDDDWNSFLVVELHLDISKNAGNLAEKHALRGFDAIHLASACSLRYLIKSKISFLTYDSRQQEAALAEGF